MFFKLYILYYNMSNFIIFLRGINVSGKHKIRMPELKEVLFEAGYTNIQTYIQSGNIFITKSNISTIQIEQEIQKIIFEKWNFSIEVFCYTIRNFLAIVKEHPYQNLEKRNYFCFYKQEVKDLLPLAPYQKDEQISLNSNCIHIQYPESYSKSKISTNFIEKKLNCIATMRNWNTVSKMLDIINTYDQKRFKTPT